MRSLDEEKVTAAMPYIQSWLEFNFANSRLPGMQIAIQHKDKVVYSQAFGFADVASQKKLTTKHAFRIASHSKTFTATAIMQLAEAGKLNLDDTVNKHLPWFQSRIDKNVALITIRQFLNHTAGLIRDGGDPDFWQLLRKFPDEKELKTYISTSKLVYKPDEQFKYSNFGFGYVGLVIEAVSGQPYRKYVTEHIIDKLNLVSTGPDLDNKARSLLAVGYGLELFQGERKAFKHIDTHDLSSATGFYSTAEDVCKYFSAHFFGDNRLLNDISKRQMQHGYWKSAGTDEHYGLGMVHYKKKGWNLYGHSGGFPGFITNTQFDAQKQLVVSVLTNARGSNPKTISSKLINIIDTFQQDIARANAKKVDLKRFEGRFYSSHGPVDIVRVSDKLFAIDPMFWGEFNAAEELSVIDSQTLKIEKANGYSSPGETVTYTFDKNGTISHIKYAGITMLSLKAARKQGWF